MNLSELKEAVIKTIQTSGMEPDLIAAILKKPQWAVDAAIRSLGLEGRVVIFRNCIKMSKKSSSTQSKRNTY